MFHHPTFNRSEVILLTNKHKQNKEILLKTSAPLRSAMPVENNCRPMSVSDDIVTCEAELLYYYYYSCYYRFTAL